MKMNARQCQAQTAASTYSASHRCLKRTGLVRIGSLYLCAHHRAAARIKG